MANDSILTTFSACGPVTVYRQEEVMKNLGEDPKRNAIDDGKALNEILSILKKTTTKDFGIEAVEIDNRRGNEGGF